ncbi:putative aldehyde dehydrogenase family 7 member A1 homolog [Rhagoletis pomonella]|uniref:putative aldehyde dehydrogenase family 7 member A1 homolog n=1 Tax=Rhagoletis pomonella TaxID=28610 RepID=UPI00177BE405|nr:putative aldehyde dehydrogenase family 7 member A1 homolog [Rhagoletis pomonella]XP_036336647.1 putative aldehyde dehydrogenase family 7 member A1 homolog [Rhagoletis pomonella]XP_036336648.1 putative aldehyde dehydrogenase family 7 member A1 homolog [Rhagoletis pomonella]
MSVLRHLNRCLLIKPNQPKLLVQSCFFHKSSTAKSKDEYLIDSPEYSFLRDIGIEQENFGVYNGAWKGSGELITSIDPGTGRKIANIRTGSVEEMDEAIEIGVKAYRQWCQVPAPVRGDIIRQIGDEMRKYKEPLGKLVSLEVGKILSEGQGEVQEFIDICDYAAGLSRIYAGQVINSERPDHTILEAWRPLGLVGIISAYNFPNAVFGWNAAIALTTGNSVLWKGAPTTSLVSVATMKILSEVLQRNNLPPIAVLCQGGVNVGQTLVSDNRVKLVSFTGSCETGRNVGVEVQKRFGKVILELGGNNALLVDQDANFNMVLEAALFGCIGTSGQRCTTTRRIIVHEKLYDRLVQELVAKYKQVLPKVGHQLDPNTLIGPVHTQQNIEHYKAAITEAIKLGGRVAFGGNVIQRAGFYAEPTIITDLPHNSPVVHRETFAPIVYILKAKSIEEAIEWNNEVDQGLSSAIFTENISNAFKWIGPQGSDCGIVNINTTTNGAEIGGAFGGEKHTGGGRESGSDAWKQYCKRATITVNHSGKLARAQGVEFNVE